MNYYLQIAEKNNLHHGVHQAVVFDDALELVFYKDDIAESNIIKQVSLAPDRVSFSRTLEATKTKICLICERLEIDEGELIYSQDSLSIPLKLSYKLLILFKMIYMMLIPVQWVIVFKGIHDKQWRKIIPDPSVFQADPFVVYNDNKYYIFYEELKFEDYHGYLKVAELDTNTGQLVNDKIILKLDYHLSYPLVFKEQNQFYMIPETGDNKSIDLYECLSFPYEWQKKQTLLDNIHAVDTTPLKTEDGWYLFTSERVDGASYDDELSIYKSKDLFEQPFEKLYDQPVINNVQKARMAGQFIQQDGDIYRLSQNCGKRYGYQANKHKVIQIEGVYLEEWVESIKPSSGAFGFHTYNQDHEIMVGDMEIARFDIYSLKRFVGGNLRRLFEIILSKGNSSKN